jgi:hypothetical protein
MRSRLSSVFVGNLLLAIGLVVIGWPSSLAAFRRAPIEALLSAVRTGNVAAPAETDLLVQHLVAAGETSPAAYDELAFVFLLAAGRKDADASWRAAQLDKAVAAFRNYLANVPGDALAWAGLSDALFSQDRRVDAMRALKMSMVTAPRSPSLLLWRCRIGLDLFYILDSEGRDLLEQQFALTMEKSPMAVVELAARHDSVPIVRSLLEDDPAALARFDELLATRHS